MSNTFLTLGLPFMIALFMGIGGCSLANKKNRNSVLWFFICFFCGLLGLIPLACAKTLEYDEDLDFKESDTLSYVMLVVALIWLGLTAWYGWNAAKAVHDQMILNFFLGR